MAEPPVWRTRPVFVTSTFRDTHAERDWLRHRVLPELEERLRARRCHLEAIDLRWGVDTADAREEEAKQLLVLKVCLAEVERSRPFLIGILGDRYGWVPPEERMEAAAREAGFEKPVTGRSITELEIDFGVLADPEQRRRCFFYLRDPLPYDRMPPEAAARYSDAHRPEPEAAGRARQLSALKARLEAELPDRVRRYRARWDPDERELVGLEAWGEQVLGDLWRELDAEIPPPTRAPTWQEEERFALEQFVEDRARGFVGREALLAELRELATSPEHEGAPWGGCVTAAAGAGKSALFAALRRGLEREPDTWVLAHAAGVSPRSTQVNAMLRRWVEELAERLGEAEPLEDDAGAEEVEETFHRLLGRASAQRRVVLLVDALNQFEPTPRAQHLTWLPRLWPPNARLVATAIPGSASRALAERPGTPEMPLPPLGLEEAGEIARARCARYHRTLNPQVLDTLLARRRADGAAAAGNPLWLELAVEELNLLDADDFARMEREFTGSGEERLLQLLLAVAADLPPEVPALYGWMLERAEAIHGRAWTRAFVNLIALSRFGWRESDLRALLPELTGEAWDDLRFAALRRTFRSHVAQRGPRSQWDFAHAQLREAVLQRNLTDASAAKSLHARLAELLEALPAEDPLHQSETMVHWLGAGEPLRAARYYGSPRTGGELAGATEALAETILEGREHAGKPALEWVCSLPAQPELPATVRRTLCNRFNFALDDRLAIEGRLQPRRDLLEAAREGIARLLSEDPENAGWQRDLSVSHNKVGDVLVAQGALGGALEAYRASLGIAEQLVGQDPGNAGWQRDLAVSHNKVGDVLVAQGALGGALEAYRASLGIRERLAAQDPGNAGWQRDLVGALSTIASASERAGLDEAPAYWRHCHEQLLSMQRAGMPLDPPLQELLALLESGRLTDTH